MQPKQSQLHKENSRSLFRTPSWKSFAVVQRSLASQLPLRLVALPQKNKRTALQASPLPLPRPALPDRRVLGLTSPNARVCRPDSSEVHSHGPTAGLVTDTEGAEIAAENDRRLQGMSGMLLRPGEKLTASDRRRAAEAIAEAQRELEQSLPDSLLSLFKKGARTSAPSRQHAPATAAAASASAQPRYDPAPFLAHVRASVRPEH